MSDVVRILNVADVENIAQKIQYRRLQFDESFEMSLGVVLMNYGDPYVKVVCIKEEWSGTKADLVPDDKIAFGSIPHCPNGHPLFEISEPPKLALIYGGES